MSTPNNENDNNLIPNKTEERISEEIKFENNKVDSSDEINILMEENNKLKSELKEIKNNNLEIKYRELLLDYQKMQTQTNELIEQNELLKNEKEEINKEASNYKNKYNLIMKEQKKTKMLLEDISLKYNTNISFQDELQKQKIKISNLISENEELKNKIEENQTIKLKENLSLLENNLKQKEKENNELKGILDNKKNDIEKYLKDIKSLKEENLKLNFQISEESEKNKILSNQFESLNNNYNLLKEHNIKIENIEKKIMEENLLNLEKIKNLEESNENHIREINDIKTKKEEEKKIYNEQLKNNEKNYEINNKALNEEINKNKKELEILNLEVGNLKIKLEQKNNENNNLISINKEINSKLNELEKDKINKNEENEKLQLEKEEITKKLNTEINKINEDYINIVEKNNNNIKELNNKIKDLIKEKNILFTQLQELLMEAESISLDYQKNLNKLKSVKFLNSEIDIQNEKVFSIEGITEPKNIGDFLSKCVEEIINLKNENYVLKNNINDLDLKINLKKEQIIDYQKENYNLKKFLGNYSSEFDHKNKLLYQMQTKNNESENLFKKENNDKKFLLSILLRILKLYPNSKIVNLLNDAFNEDLNIKFISDKESLYNIILKEIQIFENYIIELKDKKTKFGNVKQKKSINNNIIINNNTNNIGSINSINNIKNIAEKIYLKKLYQKDNKINKTQNDEKKKNK